MQNKIEVLDHGYVTLIESWGSDERIIEAARMSTNKGFQGWGPVHAVDCNKAKAIEACVFNYGPDRDKAEQTTCSCDPKPGDEKLLRYLYEHRHHTPFEMAGMIIEVQAPIFVFREWHRHRTQSYNELSARYTPMPDLNYIPTIDRLIMNQLEKEKNKQAGSVTGTLHLSPDSANEYRKILEVFYENSERFYQYGLGQGIPKELARLCIPVGRYSRMRASANLRNWLGFLTLRLDPAAQWEIRQYATAVGELIAQQFPRTWELFVEGKKHV